MHSSAVHRRIWGAEIGSCTGLGLQLYTYAVAAVLIMLLLLASGWLVVHGLWCVQGANGGSSTYGAWLQIPLRVDS